MTVMDFPTSPVNGQTSGNYYFDSTVGSSGAWRATPIPVGGLPAGSIIQWGTNTPPTNWLICDGSAVSRSTYSSLYAAIGTTYGTGNGSTTFNLPDLRGRVPVGKNSGTFGTLAGTGGAETHTLTVAEMPSHQHTQATGGNLTTALPQAGSGIIGTANTSLTTATGGGQAHNNLQPYLVVNYIIKASAGWTAGDSELATRVGAVETANAGANKSGLVPIVPSSVAVGSGSASVSTNGFITYSGASSVSLNDVFTSAYRHYRILWSVTSVATHSDNNKGFRLRTTSDDSTQIYYYGGLYQYASAGNGTNYSGSSGAVQGIIGWLKAGETYGMATLDLFNPNVASHKPFAYKSSGLNAASAIFMDGNGLVYSTTQYTGITLFGTGTGTTTGTIQVYGYR